MPDGVRVGLKVEVSRAVNPATTVVELQNFPATTLQFLFKRKGMGVREVTTLWVYKTADVNCPTELRVAPTKTSVVA